MSAARHLLKITSPTATTFGELQLLRADSFVRSYRSIADIYVPKASYLELRRLSGGGQGAASTRSHQSKFCELHSDSLLYQSTWKNLPLGLADLLVHLPAAFVEAVNYILHFRHVFLNGESYCCDEFVLREGDHEVILVEGYRSKLEGLRLLVMQKAALYEALYHFFYQSVSRDGCMLAPALESVTELFDVFLISTNCVCFHEDEADFLSLPIFHDAYQTLSFIQELPTLTVSIDSFLTEKGREIRLAPRYHYGYAMTNSINRMIDIELAESVPWLRRHGNDWTGLVPPLVENLSIKFKATSVESSTWVSACFKKITHTRVSLPDLRAHPTSNQTSYRTYKQFDIPEVKGLFLADNAGTHCVGLAPIRGPCAEPMSSTTLDNSEQLIKADSGIDSDTMSLRARSHSVASPTNILEFVDFQQKVKAQEHEATYTPPNELHTMEARLLHASITSNRLIETKYPRKFSKNNPFRNRVQPNHSVHAMNQSWISEASTYAGNYSIDVEYGSSPRDLDKADQDRQSTLGCNCRSFDSGTCTTAIESRQASGMTSSILATSESINTSDTSDCGVMVSEECLPVSPCRRPAQISITPQNTSESGSHGCNARDAEAAGTCHESDETMSGKEEIQILRSAFPVVAARSRHARLNSWNLEFFGADAATRRSVSGLTDGIWSDNDYGVASEGVSLDKYGPW